MAAPTEATQPSRSPWPWQREELGLGFGARGAGCPLQGWGYGPLTGGWDRALTDELRGVWRLEGTPFRSGRRRDRKQPFSCLGWVGLGVSQPPPWGVFPAGFGTPAFLCEACFSLRIMAPQLLAVACTPPGPLLGSIRPCQLPLVTLRFRPAPHSQLCRLCTHLTPDSLCRSVCLSVNALRVLAGWGAGR